MPQELLGGFDLRNLDGSPLVWRGGFTS